MRGKARGAGVLDVVRGITPAYAGKSSSCTRHSSRSWDHPRVCGEKFSSMWRRYMVSGSPPRMRGKVGFIVFVQTAIGITPAYAGKSTSRSAPPQAHRDHPRVCGEKCHKKFLRQSFPGITPAYAGKSQTTVCFNDVTRDHPRVCGEKTRWKGNRSRYRGSPPRMRGKD